MPPMGGAFCARSSRGFEGQEKQTMPWKPSHAEGSSSPRSEWRPTREDRPTAGAPDSESRNAAAFCCCCAASAASLRREQAELQHRVGALAVERGTDTCDGGVHGHGGGGRPRSDAGGSGARILD
jgi:hypothetical protein